MPRHDPELGEECELEGSRRSAAEEEPDDVSELNPLRAANAYDGSGGSGDHRGRAMGVAGRTQEEVPGSHVSEVFNTGPGSTTVASALPRIYPGLPVVRYQLGDGRSLLMLAGPGQTAGQAKEAAQDPQLGGSVACI